VLAAVAFQQLRTYKMNAGPPGEVDPVLVIAPALILLAAAVLVLRVLPLLTRAGERVAARSRALTSPLAAWELGRRPGRAAGAVVLLTLAVGVGTFSLSFLSTWRSSQQDQADLAIGTDVRITPADDTALAGQTATLPGVAVWHVPWHEKDDTIDWQAYFHRRNRIVAALLHTPYERGGRLIQESFETQVKHVLSMQYAPAEMGLMAIEDILEGPQRMHRDVLNRLNSEDFYNPTLRFATRSLQVGDDFAVCEWTASTGEKEWDGVDVFPLRDGLIARKDVYSSSHRAREL